MGCEPFHVQPDLLAVLLHDVAVDAAGGDRVVSVAVDVVAYGAEEGAVVGFLVAGGIEVLIDAAGGLRMERDIAQLAALAMHTQMLDAAALADVLHLEQAKLFTTQAVIEEH